MTAGALPDTGEAARGAMETGRTALTGGDFAGARRWFERAHRLAPNDPLCLHMLAAALAGTDPDRALRINAGLIAATPGDRDAHIARVALLHRSGRHADAADGLDDVLTHFAVPREAGFGRMAATVVRLAGCAGWAGFKSGAVDLCVVPHADLALDAAPPFCAQATPGQHALPASWRKARTLRVVAPSGRVLGATIDLAAMRRSEGCVVPDAQGGLRGWVRAVADPDTILVIEFLAGACLTPFASLPADDAMPIAGAPNGARGFHIPASKLTSGREIHVRIANGPPLAGSPVCLAEEARAARQALRQGTDAWRPLPISLAGILPPPPRRMPRRRRIDIVIPLYRNAAQAEACVASLRPTLPRGARIVAVDDASPDPDLRAWADRAATAGEIVLLRHATNRGFPAAANTAIRHATTRDIVLLNSDTLLPPDAIACLADAAYAAADIGTATPMTQDGSLTTLGTPGQAEPMPDGETLQRIAAMLREANNGVRIAIPTCVGFCVYIRHDCLAETGLLREDAFAQGYGEENDFSRRAAMLGWRHVAACDVFVAHRGGVSFGAARPALMARNLAVLERLHPGYAASIAEFLAGDPLRPARAAYDRARWSAERRSGAVVLVTHDHGGGVERYVAARAATIRAATIPAEAARAIVVRPRNGYTVSDGTANTHPNLVFETVEALADFLRADAPRAVEMHHIAAHAPGIARLPGLLGVKFDIIVHDYAAVCPRITLRGDTFCDGPKDARDCDDCVADFGAHIEITGNVAALRAAHASLFAEADRVVVATQDTARRLRRVMPALHAIVQPWEDDALLPPCRPPAPHAWLHVAIAGAIGPDKGFNTVLACARDAARRDLPLHFTIVGHTIGDRRLLDTGRVFITGPFTEGEAPALLREAGADLGLVPSAWPETWCYALTDLWQAGLHVLAFDFGAPAERIRRRGAGTLAPPGLPAPALNDFMLQLANVSHGGAPRKLAANG